MSKKLINLTGISKSYGDHVVLDDLNLYIRENEFITLLGPSGCGKTTTLRIIGGFEAPDAGSVVFDGKDITSLPPNERNLNTVFQKYALFPHMSIAENIAFGLRIKKKSKEYINDKIRYALKLVNLEGFENRSIDSLSGGQQQRIAIARSLLLKPSVLLLDEPFSALDAKIRHQMREELKKIQNDLGITVVFVTHDQEEAMSLSHRIVVMNKGKFEQVGTPTEIYDTPNCKYVASFIGEMNFVEENGKTIAFRPENVDIVAPSADCDIRGTVRTIMILGHYVVVTIQCGETLVKCNVDRAVSEKLTIGEEVGLKATKYLTF